MKSKLLVSAGLLTLAVAVGGTAYAATGGHRMGMMKHMISNRIEKMEDAIGATPQQRAVIEQSKSTIFAAIEQRKAQKAGQRGRGQLVALLTADKLDTNALYALANSHAQDIQDLAKVVVPELQKVHDVLTPQQRQLLAQKAQQMHGRHHGHGGGFGGPDEE